MGRFLAASLLSVCLAWGGVASAQEGGELTDEEARNLYQAGAIAFDQGRFENALDYFERAYALSKRPQLLFNVGVVADRMRLDERALQAFEQYLAQVPDGAEAAHVRARIDVLRKTLSQRPSDPQPPPPVQATPVPAPDSPPLNVQASAAAPAPHAAPARPEQPRDTLLPWLLVGAGAAVGITGGVLLAVGQSRRAMIEDAEVGTSWSDVADYEDADTFTGLGAAALAVGAATAVIGVVLLTSGDEGDVDPAHTRLLLGPGGLSLRGAL